MKNRIYNAFDTIGASQQLKDNTLDFLRQRAYEKKHRSFRRFAVALASIAFVFVCLSLSYNIYFTQAAFIDIDVNPGIELTLNRFDRIIASHAYNDEGQEVLDRVDIEHKTYVEAFELLIDTMVEMGYISDAGLFTATLQMNDPAKQDHLLELMREYISLVLQSDGKTVEQDIFTVDSSTKVHSHEQNLTPAKYLAILELQQIDPTATFDSCRSHTVNEIRHRQHSHSSASPDGSDDSSEEEGKYSENSDGQENDSQSAAHGQGQGHGQESSQNHGSSKENHNNNGSSHVSEDAHEASAEQSAVHQGGQGGGNHQGGGSGQGGGNHQGGGSGQGGGNHQGKNH